MHKKKQVKVICLLACKETAYENLECEGCKKLIVSLKNWSHMNFSYHG